MHVIPRTAALMVLATGVLGGCEGREDVIFRPIGDASIFDAPEGDGNLIPDALGIDAYALNDAGVDPKGPDVMITSHSKDVIVVESRSVVRCKATANTMTAIAIKDVTLDVFDQTGAQKTATGVSLANNTYEAPFTLTEFPNGEFTIRCVATDLKGHRNENVVKTKLDLGPVIAIDHPQAGEAFRGNVSVEFRVTESKIEKNDTGAAIKSVAAFMAGKDLKGSDKPPTMGQSGNYQTVVRSDDDIFDQPLDGDVTFQVRATNERGVTREALVTFVIDNVPPQVTIVSPIDNSLLAGKFTIQAKVTDTTKSTGGDNEGQVDATSVVAVIGHGVVESLAVIPLDRHVVGTEVYEADFEASRLREVYETMFPGSELVFPTISVRARDSVGNEGSQGKVYGMDYTPPLIALDPPVIRIKSKGTTVCSVEFDPLGNEAVQDGQSVLQLSDIRARIIDRPNRATSTKPKIFPTAGVDDDRVQLFILSHSAVGPGDALVVDTNGDGVCDDINPMLVPTTTPVREGPFDVLVADLGRAGDECSIFWVDEEPTDGRCLPPVVPTNVFVPDAVCHSTGVQCVLPNFDGAVPDIYGVKPLDVRNYCIGSPVDMVANGIDAGWACVAVRAVDKVGMVGVSRPLRVCFAKDRSSVPADCPEPPSLGGGPDTPEYSPVVVATMDPGFECTGTYYRGNENTAPRLDPAQNCTLPSALFDYEPRELVVRDTGYRCFPGDLTRECGGP